MIPATYDSEVLSRAVRTALDSPDGDWYRNMIRKDACGCRLNQEEERAVLDGAVRTAAALARRFTARYGELSPEELGEALSLKLVQTSGELLEAYLYIGLYEPASRTITLNGSALGLIRQFIDANGLGGLTPPDDIMRLALFHEIFHALEEETPGIYTRSRMLERKMLGIFPYRRGLDSVSEVGAVHFSKSMVGVAYSPCIYQQYLLLALGQLSIDFLAPNV
ncbi:Uncharacterised protein [Mycobacterium tuberculosis]|nr:Uncharacterised protein [Mycobacterium tuberculosis]